MIWRGQCWTRGERQEAVWAESRGTGDSSRRLNHPIDGSGRKGQFTELDIYVKGVESQPQSRNEKASRLIFERSWAWRHMAVIEALRR